MDECTMIGDIKELRGILESIKGRMRIGDSASLESAYMLLDYADGKLRRMEAQRQGGHIKYVKGNIIK